MTKTSYRCCFLRSRSHAKDRAGRVLLLLLLLLVAFTFGCQATHSEPRQRARTALSLRPQAEGDRRCLSLRVLQQQAAAAAAAGQPLSEDLRTLAGIGWLEGFVVDPENEDVILIGRRVPGWPSLLLDDLAVNLRNILQSGPQPFCSLDPLPEDVKEFHRIVATGAEVQEPEALREWFEGARAAWGPQKVVLGGVPRPSHHAHVIIDADYHMKKVCQGLVEVPGVQSTLGRSIEEATRAIRERRARPASGMSMSRFWFRLAEGDPRFRIGTRGAVWLDRCTVQVLTERQMATADGQLYDAGGDDPDARAFAAEFSREFEQLTTVVPVYAELENLYRLCALLRAMHRQQALSQAGVDLAFLLTGFRCQDEHPMPATLPGLTNLREAKETVEDGDHTITYTLFRLVSGGVSMEIPLADRQFDRKQAAALDRLQVAAIAARPGPASLWWALLATL